MPDPARTVFLSYRREVSWPLAQLVFRDLTEHGFDVFMDTASLDSGEFERVILAQIEARTHFLLLLEPRSLDRIGERRRLAAPRDRARAGPRTQHRAAARRVVSGFRGPPSCRPTWPRLAVVQRGVGAARLRRRGACSKLRERFLRPHGAAGAASPSPREPSAHGRCADAAHADAGRASGPDGRPARAGRSSPTSDYFELERSPEPRVRLSRSRSTAGRARGYVDERARTGDARTTGCARSSTASAGPWSDVVAVQTDSVVASPARPARSAPPILRLAPEGTSVRLSWTSVQGAADYEVDPGSWPAARVPGPIRRPRTRSGCSARFRSGRRTRAAYRGPELTVRSWPARRAAVLVRAAWSALCRAAAELLGGPAIVVTRS